MSHPSQDSAPYPDVCGLEQEDAVRRLAHQEVAVSELRWTSPPDPARLSVRARVVQQRIAPEGIILILTREMSPRVHFADH